MIYSQKMIFLLLLIAALASELVKSDSSESAERRHGQWGQDRNWWGHGGNQWRHGRNHGEHGGDLRGQSGSHREHDGNQRGHDSNSNARLAICRFLDRCPNVGEVNGYASAYNGKTHELVRVLADSGDFEQHFIANKQDACQTLYRKLLERNVDPDGQFLCSKVIPALGYRWLKNQLIDSSEYHQKFGTNTVPGNGNCPRDCIN